MLTPLNYQQKGCTINLTPSNNNHYHKHPKLIRKYLDNKCCVYMNEFICVSSFLFLSCGVRATQIRLYYYHLHSAPMLMLNL
mmetsp:Transcript_81249/g.159487  ORF Transcript_81249/g.159487 Transcript_81249/m.159487 type:complete len:82 (+) Transcript_81249:173-418(+)